MPLNDEKLLKRLQISFINEAHEHVQSISSGLLVLEQHPASEDRAKVLDTVFRSAHSLKGAARTVNRADVERVCQSMESAFDGLRRGTLEADEALFDELHRSLTSLESLLNMSPELLGTGPNESVPPIQAQSSASQPSGRTHSPDTVRIGADRLDAILLQAEELLSIKLSASRRVTELKNIHALTSGWHDKWSRLQSDARVLQQTASDPSAARIVEFLDWNREFMHSFKREIAALSKTAGVEQRSAGAMVDTLFEDAKKAAMLPFATLVQAFPRFVRELSRELGKEVDLEINGGEIEMDRRVLDEMKDPITHMIRNAIDHGIEPPDVRVREGKHRHGKIAVSLLPMDSSHVELAISDDGAGIDLATVQAAAARTGIQTDPKDPLVLIFESRVSTSPIVTDISGRGLGLAIVKECVERLGGEVSVSTQFGRGTTFRMVLPLTLSRFRGLVVRVEDRLFVLPTNTVEHVMRVRKDEINTVENRESVCRNGTIFAIVRLGSVLDVPHREPETAPTTVPIVVLTSNGQRMAFMVDEILHEQEVLVKSLGKQLLRVRNISSATILETGVVVPIVNVSDLMKSAIRNDAPVIAVQAAPAAAAVKHSLLVAEDSITSRTLLKSILETAGYLVETAVDGVEAYTKLRSGRFDLIVSDVDMPRMNGFGLTAKVRADKKLADIPVVLVTALDSRADREHGIDVGANAYIVKSSFDQGNLLEVIRQLL